MLEAPLSPGAILFAAPKPPWYRRYRRRIVATTFFLMCCGAGAACWVYFTNPLSFRTLPEGFRIERYEDEAHPRANEYLIMFDLPFGNLTLFTRKFKALLRANIPGAAARLHYRRLARVQYARFCGPAPLLWLLRHRRRAAQRDCRHDMGQRGHLL